MATIIKSDKANARKLYTVRYRDSFGKQREKSFKTRTEAKTFVTDQDKAKRYGGDVNVAATRKPFTPEVERYLATLKEGGTKSNYQSAYRKWIKPAYGDMTVTEAARSYTVAETLLNTGDLAKCHKVARSRVRTLLARTLDMLVKEDVIQSHKIRTVVLAEVEYESPRPSEFVEITPEDAEHLAKECGFWVTLQYRLGLRVSEAIGLHKEDFIPSVNGGAVLHLTSQAARGGKTRIPLKAKSKNDFRDIPVPADIWTRVKDMPEGPLFPAKRNPYLSYGSARSKFSREAEKIGFKNLGTHQLRHMFATNLFRKGANILMVSKLLGHADVAVTSRVYVHLLPSDHASALEFMSIAA